MSLAEIGVCGDQLWNNWDKTDGTFLFFFSAQKFLEHIMHKEGRPATDLCERSTNTCSYPTEAG